MSFKLRITKGDKILFIMIITFFLCFGVFFVGVLFEEVFHVLDSSGRAQSICVSMNMFMNDDVQKGYLVAYTTFKPGSFESPEAFSDWRSRSEKVVFLARPLVNIVLSIFIGFMLCLVINFKEVGGEK